MLVVADSSPIITLVKIQQVDLLPKFFQRLIIPPAVATELSDPRRSAAVRELIESAPDWLETMSPTALKIIPGLHPGESEAISLALELHAELLLIDERTGYRAAKARGFSVVGFLGILERGAREALLDLREAFDRLRRDPTIWINHKLLDQRLDYFLKDRLG
ncbi:MAG: DUF3368 domain-containing protein [Planctomycetes bacterium]|nr:DUF3368 domain-containing protein [Planctomycetota bacterium]MBI3833941.1 DUF3368 domain-containing protein [Planctomycetota bacterium]